MLCSWPRGFRSSNETKQGTQKINWLEKRFYTISFHLREGTARCRVLKQNNNFPLIPPSTVTIYIQLRAVIHYCWCSRSSTASFIIDLFSQEHFWYMVFHPEQMTHSPFQFKIGLPQPQYMYDMIPNWCIYATHFLLAFLPICDSEFTFENISFYPLIYLVLLAVSFY